MKGAEKVGCLFAGIDSVRSLSSLVGFNCPSHIFLNYEREFKNLGRYVLKSFNICTLVGQWLPSMFDTTISCVCLFIWSCQSLGCQAVLTTCSTFGFCGDMSFTSLYGFTLFVFTPNSFGFVVPVISGSIAPCMYDIRESAGT